MYKNNIPLNQSSGNLSWGWLTTNVMIPEGYYYYITGNGNN